MFCTDAIEIVLLLYDDAQDIVIVSHRASIESTRLDSHCLTYFGRSQALIGLIDHHLRLLALAFGDFLAHISRISFTCSVMRLRAASGINKRIDIACV